MDNYVTMALQIVEAQASIRVMSEDELVSMLQKLTASVRQIAEVEETPEAPAVPPGKSIKEKSIICLECGQTFKLLSSRHLASHGLTPAAYKEKWKLKPGTALVCKSLQRERKKKMLDMKLWERRTDRKAQTVRKRRVRVNNNAAPAAENA